MLKTDSSAAPRDATKSFITAAWVTPRAFILDRAKRLFITAAKSRRLASRATRRPPTERLGFLRRCPLCGARVLGPWGAMGAPPTAPHLTCVVTNGAPLKRGPFKANGPRPQLKPER